MAACVGSEEGAVRFDVGVVLRPWWRAVAMIGLTAPGQPPRGPSVSGRWAAESHHSPDCGLSVRGFRTSRSAAALTPHLWAGRLPWPARPEIQYPAEAFKSDASRTPVPIPRELALELSAAVRRWGGSTVVTDPLGKPLPPWAIERAVRATRGNVPGLPEGFRFHDLRHPPLRR